jgi:enolase-phosphatase E1
VTPRAILTDIEGTTSSIAFVHDVLFPYSRARLAEYVAAHASDPEVAAILEAVRAEAGVPTLNNGGCTALLLAWHDADRKFAPLKALQGLIWATGYAEGKLQGHVYADAVAGLRRWKACGIALYVYSSGSVSAQKLIFGNTAFGDLTPLFSGYFDTAIGGKKEAASYAAIANEIGVAPGDILFLSDVEAELAAALSAGMMVTLLARDEVPLTSPYPVVERFDEILADRVCT